MKLRIFVITRSLKLMTMIAEQKIIIFILSKELRCCLITDGLELVYIIIVGNHQLRFFFFNLM